MSGHAAGALALMISGVLLVAVPLGAQPAGAAPVPPRGGSGVGTRGGEAGHGWTPRWFAGVRWWPGGHTAGRRAPTTLTRP